MVTAHSMERTQVFWITPEDGTRQHATLREPPAEGGKVEVLGGHSPVFAPEVRDRRGYQMWHTRPFCEECFTAYLKLPIARPDWKS